MLETKTEVRYRMFNLVEGGRPFTLLKYKIFVSNQIKKMWT